MQTGQFTLTPDPTCTSKEDQGVQIGYRLLSQRPECLQIVTLQACPCGPVGSVVEQFMLTASKRTVRYVPDKGTVKLSQQARTDSMSRSYFWRANNTGDIQRRGSNPPVAIPTGGPDRDQNQEVWRIPLANTFVLLPSSWTKDRKDHLEILSALKKEANIGRLPHTHTPFAIPTLTVKENGVRRSPFVAQWLQARCRLFSSLAGAILGEKRRLKRKLAI